MLDTVFAAPRLAGCADLDAMQSRQLVVTLVFLIGMPLAAPLPRPPHAGPGFQASAWPCGTETIPGGTGQDYYTAAALDTGFAVTVNCTDGTSGTCTWRVVNATAVQCSEEASRSETHPLATLRAAGGKWVNSIARPLDGGLLVVGSGGVSLFLESDIARGGRNGPPSALWSAVGASSVAVLPRGGFVVGCDFDDRVLIFESNGELAATWRVSGVTHLIVALLRDGRLAVGGYGEGPMVRLFDAEALRQRVANASASATLRRSCDGVFVPTHADVNNMLVRNSGELVVGSLACVVVFTLDDLRRAGPEGLEASLRLGAPGPACIIFRGLAELGDGRVAVGCQYTGMVALYTFNSSMRGRVNASAQLAVPSSVGSLAVLEDGALAVGTHYSGVRIFPAPVGAAEPCALQTGVVNAFQGLPWGGLAAGMVDGSVALFNTTTQCSAATLKRTDPLPHLEIWATLKAPKRQRAFPLPAGDILACGASSCSLFSHGALQQGGRDLKPSAELTHNLDTISGGASVPKSGLLAVAGYRHGTHGFEVRLSLFNDSTARHNNTVFSPVVEMPIEGVSYEPRVFAWRNGLAVSAETDDYLQLHLYDGSSLPSARAPKATPVARLQLGVQVSDEFPCLVLELDDDVLLVGTGAGLAVFCWGVGPWQGDLLEPSKRWAGSQISFALRLTDGAVAMAGTDSGQVYIFHTADLCTEGTALQPTTALQLEAAAAGLLAFDDGAIGAVELGRGVSRFMTQSREPCPVGTYSADGSLYCSACEGPWLSLDAAGACTYPFWTIVLLASAVIPCVVCIAVLCQRCLRRCKGAGSVVGRHEFACWLRMLPTILAIEAAVVGLWPCAYAVAKTVGDPSAEAIYYCTSAWILLHLLSQHLPRKSTSSSSQGREESLTEASDRFAAAAVVGMLVFFVVGLSLGLQSVALFTPTDVTTRVFTPFGLVETEGSYWVLWCSWTVAVIIACHVVACFRKGRNATLARDQGPWKHAERVSSPNRCVGMLLPRRCVWLLQRAKEWCPKQVMVAASAVSTCGVVALQLVGESMVGRQHMVAVTIFELGICCISIAALSVVAAMRGWVWLPDRHFRFAAALKGTLHFLKLAFLALPQARAVTAPNDFHNLWSCAAPGACPDWCVADGLGECQYAAPDYLTANGSATCQCFLKGEPAAWKRNILVVQCALTQVVVVALGLENLPKLYTNGMPQLKQVVSSPKCALVSYGLMLVIAPICMMIVTVALKFPQRTCYTTVSAVAWVSVPCIALAMTTTELKGVYAWCIPDRLGHERVLSAGGVREYSRYACSLCCASGFYLLTALPQGHQCGMLPSSHY